MRRQTKWVLILTLTIYILAAITVTLPALANSVTTSCFANASIPCETFLVSTTCFGIPGVNLTCFTSSILCGFNVSCPTTNQSSQTSNQTVGVPEFGGSTLVVAAFGFLMVAIMLLAARKRVESRTDANGAVAAE